MKTIVVICAGIGLVCAAARVSYAFQISSLATAGCHESITLNASLESGWPGAQTPPPLTETERRIIEDLPFDLDNAAHDPWRLALIIGVRYNDLRGNSPTDVAELVHVHNDPDDQPAHCMRRGEDDGAAGDQTALDACKAFIIAQLELAIGTGASVDIEARVPVTVSLAFRGRVDVNISRFGYHLGRALHALQDGHSHTFRSPSDGRVRHVLNWIDYLRRSDYSEERDGHRHVGVLDDCTRSEFPSVVRTARATAASAALLDVIADDTGGAAGRLARAAIVLDAHLELEPNCTFENSWCDAQEPFESGCAAGDGSLATLILVGLALLVFGRRRAAASVALALVMLSGSIAHADRPLPDIVAQDLPKPMKHWAAYGGLSGSLDHGAIAETVALRWYRWKRFGLGLDIEHNPWFSIDAARFAPGTINAYATAIYRHKTDGWELRTSVHIGTSILLFDMVGVDKGSVGLYVGISPLGLAIPLRGGFRLIIDPGDLALPVPLLKGVPFYYGQYRFTVGIEKFL